MVLSSATWSKLVVQLALKYHMDLFSRNSKRVISFGTPCKQLTRTYLSQNQPVKTRSSQVKFKFESTDLTFFVFLIFIFAEFDFDSERTWRKRPASFRPSGPILATLCSNTCKYKKKFKFNTNTSTMYILFLSAWSVVCQSKYQNEKWQNLILQ